MYKSLRLVGFTRTISAVRHTDHLTVPVQALFYLSRIWPVLEVGWGSAGTLLWLSLGIWNMIHYLFLLSCLILFGKNM